MAELRLENLGKTFPGKRGAPHPAAVTEFSLEVRSGECVALLGPSGAGKTTVLRLVAGLESPDSGDVKLEGASITKQRPGERQISMAFQNPALLPQLTVRENLVLSSKLRGLPATGSEQIIDLLGIAHLLERKPESLSGGEQQRVALGRALCARPKLLLLDEPLANLDPLARLDLRETIRRLQRELKVTTVYITHDQSEAAEIADRIAILRSGRLEQFASSAGLYHQPANLFVARFFGPEPLNVLRGRVLAGQLDLGEAQIPLSGSIAAPEGTELQLSFRQSAAQIARAASGWAVREVRALGWTHILHLELGPHQITCATHNAAFQTGDRVQLTIPPERLYLFTATGENFFTTGISTAKLRA